MSLQRDVRAFRVPRRNRIDPWSDVHAASGRGLFTGNRGCLVDDYGTVVRHHRSPLWITCVTEFRDWRHPLAAPHRWTPIFFLDDAVALAAGHRPCAFCRREAYRSYRDAVSVSVGVSEAAARGGSSIGGSSASATAAVGEWTAPLTVWCGRRASTTCRPARSCWTTIVGRGC